MKIEKLYEASSKWDALSELSKRPELAFDPIQIVQVKGQWCIARIDRSNILNQTLYIVHASISRFLWAPHECPGHWMELRSLQDDDPQLTKFCHEVANEFNEEYQSLSGESYLTKLDEFMDKKIRELR
jgi:hypothetical protein